MTRLKDTLNQIRNSRLEMPPVSSAVARSYFHGILRTSVLGAPPLAHPVGSRGMNLLIGVVFGFGSLPSCCRGRAALRPPDTSPSKNVRALALGLPVDDPASVSVSLFAGLPRDFESPAAIAVAQAPEARLYLARHAAQRSAGNAGKPLKM